MFYFYFYFWISFWSIESRQFFLPINGWLSDKDIIHVSFNTFGNIIFIVNGLFSSTVQSIKQEYKLAVTKKKKQIKEFMDIFTKLV